ncbi:hypothetical protein LY90DRAFT_678449 [Neocallimastix californiae]|uniref:AAA-ATPase-like domain-containing protein n=1 Tax=Neocallimastix californiae TaxID=1754190 RepID=A0A1Y1Z529_9FUNG|nr:hypothetical protein LY90DRAFT_678449 [Neocallimastix californiae]|eukprot:ORY05402.1 hypothetical protein LY90DRAFT_678449 [Neocallimastix californiae]
MIKEFFEKPINEIENEDKKFVFDGLEVSKDRKNMRHFHKYPVIYLNFKGIQGNNFEEIKNFLIDIISTLFKNMRNKIEFEKLDDLDKRDWNEIENKNNLSFMCSCLRKFYKRRCIILIDEYDQVLINSIKKKVFDIVQPIIERIFSCAFKGNDNLYFGVITGCYHFGLNSSNSGANNFTKCSLLKDNYFSDCYGFTEDELKNILSNFNITDSKEKSDDIEDGIKERLKKKYGGYSCVSNIGIIKNIYNPYSVMKFVQKNKNKRDNFELSNYWNYPEKNEKLKNFLKNSNFNFNAKFLNLLCGKIFTSFHHLPISNKKKSKKSKKTTESTELTESSPPEHFYQLFLMQLFFNLNVKGLAVEQESGHGIIDIGFPHEKVKDEYIIIEIKVSKSDDKNSLSEACKIAINQIEKKYMMKNLNLMILKVL